MAEDKSRAKAMEAVEAIFERYVLVSLICLFFYFGFWVSGCWVFCSERFWFWEVL